MTLTALEQFAPLRLAKHQIYSQAYKEWKAVLKHLNMTEREYDDLEREAVGEMGECCSVPTESGDLFKVEHPIYEYKNPKLLYTEFRTHIKPKDDNGRQEEEGKV